MLLEELALYRLAGRFPENDRFEAMTPFFIDRHGTRCAMAHLMEIGGAAELVQEIARTKNNAYIAELARDPRVVAWLDAAGLTVAEAARIQPSYCRSAANACVCDFQGSAFAGATVEGELVARDGGPTMMKITKMLGEPSGVCAGVHVGDVVRVQRDDPHPIAPLAKSHDYAKGVDECAAVPTVWGQSDKPMCQGMTSQELPGSLTIEELHAAYTARDCEAKVAEKGEAWSAKPDCTSDTVADGVFVTALGTCSASAPGAPVGGELATGAILVALLAHRVARMARARAR
jgi:hypothetical protein